MARVTLTNVNKIFEGGFHAVKDANIEIKDKEFMVLVGPSGCGKTTSLRMVAGLEDITSGEIRIGERIVNNIAPKDRDIAMVFQNYALYPHMTVYDNLAFGLKLRKFSKKDIHIRVQEAAEILGLAELLDRKPKALSGGQRQRVAVGRAIVRHPQVFLFDEPLSNLDAKLRVQMRAEINKLHKDLEATMIYVTHDQVEAMTMGDRITVMKDGVIQQIDTPLNLYDDPINIFVAGFIGSPSMNFVEGKLIKENGLFFVAPNVKIDLPEKFNNHADPFINREVVLGIRPEHISLSKELDLRAEVEVVEPMGNEIFIYCKMNNQKLLARVSTREIPQSGEIIFFKVEKDNIHIFDKQSEKTILPL
ncbi:MAG: sn-glycerol-3-phosphate ABC transporter ATP-binding protein UgpC [Candidatus Cloacimonetes bacterium]|nr:sn-glycerol-3-phosphate ABC transporter ATP-binding protein UgpC [Candidatus Cloacimonadota bacterium]